MDICAFIFVAVIIFLLVMALAGISQPTHSSALQKQADNLQQIGAEARRQADDLSDAYVKYAYDYVREHTRGSL